MLDAKLQPSAPLSTSTSILSSVAPRAVPWNGLWTFFVEQVRTPQGCAEGGNVAEGRQIFVSSFIHHPGDTKQEQ